MCKDIIYKTALSLLGDFHKTFRSLLYKGMDIIHLSAGSSISQGSINWANLIAKELNE